MNLKNEIMEYIDTYDEKHNFIKSVEKKEAHKLKLWHSVVGTLIINPNTYDAFFQLKNHNHNNISKKDLLEITAGGHLRSGETLKDSIREIEEETGLKVLFEDMIFINERICDEDNNMIIREFQYYYLLPMNIDLNSFNPKDDEVIGFVKINLDKALSVICNNKIELANLKINNETKYIYINKSFFDKAFINNGVFLNLLTSAKKFIKGDF